MEEANSPLVKRIRQLSLSLMLASTRGASRQHGWHRLNGIRYERPVHLQHMCYATLVSDVQTACAWLMGTLALDEEEFAVYLMTSHHETTAVRLFKHDGLWFCVYVLVGPDARSNTLVCGVADALVTAEEAPDCLRSAMHFAVDAGLIVESGQPIILIGE